MKNFNKTVFSVLLLLVALVFGHNAMAQWNGSGTQQTPYQITSKADLATLATNVNSGTNYNGTYFLLTTDLTYTYTYAWNSTDGNAAENNFIAIGGYGHSFQGHFDGGGHTISGIRIYKNGTTTSDELQGVFGYLSNGSVRNLTVADASITGYQQVGGIAGCNSTGTIEDCVVASNVGIYRVADNASKHGGIVGANTNGNIRRCTSSATIRTNPKYANTVSAICGGIIGYQSQSIASTHYVENNIALNVVVQSGKSVGGAIIGHRTSGDNLNRLHLTNNYYRNCTINGSVNATNVGLGNPAGDIDGARSVHPLTLGTNITATGESVVIGNTTYYASNTTVTLGHNNSTGYLVTYRLNGDALSGNTFTMPNNDNGTVSATLTPITYYVHFDKNNDGATGTMSDQQFTYGQAQNLTANAFSRAYYNFVGWSLTPDGAVAYTDQQSVSNLTTEDGETVTFYAKWNVITYNITYNLNGGSVATANPTTYNVETPTFTLNNPTKPGYTFDGWTGTGLAEPTQTVTIALGSNGDRSYTANWTPNTYTVHFDANGGEGSMDDMNFTYDVAQSLTANAFTREDFSFSGWNTQANGSGTSYTDGQSVSNLTTEPNGTVNLYAQWRLNIWQGSGTENDPYIINSTAGLNLLAYVVNNNIDNNNGFANKYFRQTENLTYNGTTNNYTPIGNNSRYFKGHYDGGGFTISGINVTGSDNYIGVFGYVYYGSVENIVVANSTFTGNNRVGGIAGYTYSGSVSNCKVMSDVTIGTPNSSGLYHGGIVGYLAQTELSGCLSMAILTDPNDVGSSYGGIAGLNSNGTINNCIYMGGSVTAHNNAAAIARINGQSSAFSNNYYFNCTVNGATAGVGVGGADINGAQPAHTITLGENIAIVGDQTTYSLSGLTAIGTTVLIHTVGSTSTIYSGAKQTVTLNYTGEMPEGYSLIYNDGADHPTIGNAFMMPDANVTVSISNAFPTIPGMGTEDNPFVISSKEQLNLLAEMVNSGYLFTNKYFKLGANINYNPNELTNNNYTAIGITDSEDSRYCFDGTFDGDDHIISGIRINQLNYPQALFGCVSSNGTVKNVTLNDAVITGSYAVGGIAGANKGTVENCRVVNAEITGNYWVGGIVGYNDCVLIENCLVLNTSITYSGTDNHVGGAIIGIQYTDNFNNNYYNSCTVNGVASNIGCGAGPDTYGWTFGDITTNNGAMPAYALTLGEHLTTTPALNATFNNIDYYTAGTEVTLGTNPPAYTITSATLTYGGNNYSIVPEGGVYSFDMPAADATVTATMEVHCDCYQLFTGYLVEGDYLIVYDGKAMKNVISNHAFQYEEVTASNDVITTDDTSIIWRIVKNNRGRWTIYNAAIERYVCCEHSGGPSLSSNESNQYAEWCITGSNEFYNAADYMKFLCFYNDNISGFRVLLAGYGDSRLSFYKRIATPTETYTLNINGYGNSTTDGWRLIASPVSTTPSEVENMLTNETVAPYSYDLYRFNQSAAAEWENYHQHSSDFNINPRQGYLYANSEDVTLTFTGIPYRGNGHVVLISDYYVSLSGWNLVGNPFGVEATINKDFYRMNDEGSEIIPATGNTVNAMEGIFVQTEDYYEYMKFTPVSGDAKGSRGDDASLVINLSKGNRGSAIDRAIVRFDSERTMTKLQIFDGSTKLYIPQDGTDYAVACSNRQGEIPLNFKAKETGKYTISFEGIDLKNIKLIDVLEGIEIDLNENPSYTFIGSPADRQARFKIRFEGSENSDSSDIFAYQSGTEIIITGEGELQIFDLMGRMVMQKYVNGIQTIEKPQTTGVYIFKLKGKTQKIIIK